MGIEEKKEIRRDGDEEKKLDLSNEVIYPLKPKCLQFLLSKQILLIHD